MVRSRPTRLIIAALAALAIPIAISAPTEAATTPTRYGFGGYAFGSKVNVLGVVKSGPTALVSMGCTTNAGVSASNSTGTVTLPTLGGIALGKVGVTTNTVTTGLEDSLGVMTSSAGVLNLNLLGGLVKAGVIESQAVVKGKPFETSGTSSLANLTISGQKIAADPGPNTKVTLGSLGYVILNEQSSTITGNAARMTVTALHVVLLPSKSNPGGINIEIAKSEATLTGIVAGAITGYAYGTKVNLLSGIAKSGPTAPVYLPCYGTDGSTVSNSIGTVTLPNVATVGAVSSSGSGTDTPGDASATVTNSTGAVSLFGGVVKVNAIKAELSSTRVAGATQVLTDTSQILGLTVNGTTYGDSTPPNTQINVPGIGTLWVHRVVVLPNGVTEVRGLELVLSAATGGLPIGTSVKVGVAGLLIAD